MDYIELAKIIAWPIVWIGGFIVLLIYRKPLGIILSNLKKGKFSGGGKGEPMIAEIEMGKSNGEILEKKDRKKLKTKEIDVKKKIDMRKEKIKTQEFSLQNKL